MIIIMKILLVTGVDFIQESTSLSTVVVLFAKTSHRLNKYLFLYKGRKKAPVENRNFQINENWLGEPLQVVKTGEIFKRFNRKQSRNLIENLN